MTADSQLRGLPADRSTARRADLSGEGTTIPDLKDAGLLGMLGVREHYPSNRESARRSLGYFNNRSPLSACPKDTLPGTPEPIEVYAQRVGSGYKLWHSDAAVVDNVRTLTMANALRKSWTPQQRPQGRLLSWRVLVNDVA